jgi:hypothetical protein
MNSPHEPAPYRALRSLAGASDDRPQVRVSGAATAEEVAAVLAAFAACGATGATGTGDVANRYERWRRGRLAALHLTLSDHPGN